MTDITLKDAEPPPGNKRKHGKGASKTQETPKKKVTAPVLRGPGGRFLSSGNPNGRPAAALEVRELAREHGPEAIARLVHWMRSGCAQDSIAATKILLDRGYGKVADKVIGDPDNPVQTKVIFAWEAPSNKNWGQS